MNAPDYVQNVYTRTLADGLPGSLADVNPKILRSFISEADSIPFGRAISLGSFYGPPVGAILGGGSVAATAGYMQGSASLGTIAAFQLIDDGAIKITIDGAVVTLTALDFSTCQTYADVAEVIDTALDTEGACSFSAVTGCFRITSPTTGSASAVTVVADNSTGTSLLAPLGLTGTPITVAGIASHTATVLGITVNAMTVEAGARTLSNTPGVREGDVGAYLVDGLVKVLAKENVSAGGDVYYDHTTGEIWGTTSASRSKLGSSVFKASASAGSVVIIDVIGLR